MIRINLTYDTAMELVTTLSNNWYDTDYIRQAPSMFTQGYYGFLHSEELQLEDTEKPEHYLVENHEGMNYKPFKWFPEDTEPYVRGLFKYPGLSREGGTSMRSLLSGRFIKDVKFLFDCPTAAFKLKQIFLEQNMSQLNRLYKDIKIFEDSTFTHLIKVPTELWRMVNILEKKDSAPAFRSLIPKEFAILGTQRYKGRKEISESDPFYVFKPRMTWLSAYAAYYLSKDSEFIDSVLKWLESARTFTNLFNESCDPSIIGLQPAIVISASQARYLGITIGMRDNVDTYKLSYTSKTDSYSYSVILKKTRRVIRFPDTVLSYYSITPYYKRNIKSYAANYQRYLNMFPKLTCGGDRVSHDGWLGFCCNIPYVIIIPDSLYDRYYRVTSDEWNRILKEHSKFTLILTSVGSGWLHTNGVGTLFTEKSNEILGFEPKDTVTMGDDVLFTTTLEEVMSQLKSRSETLGFETYKQFVEYFFNLKQTSTINIGKYDRALFALGNYKLFNSKDPSNYIRCIWPKIVKTDAAPKGYSIDDSWYKFTVLREWVKTVPISEWPEDPINRFELLKEGIRPEKGWIEDYWKIAALRDGLNSVLSGFNDPPPGINSSAMKSLVQHQVHEELPGSIQYLMDDVKNLEDVYRPEWS